MALYANAAYRAAYQGYIVAAKQSGVLVPPDATADPTPNISPDLAIGLCQLPAWNITENFQPVESIGSMRDVSYIPGRREATISTRILVSDASIFANADATTPSYVAIRNHDDPDAAGTVNGLQLVAIEVGTAQAYGNAFGKMGVDCLLNTLRFTFGENQPVTAEAEFWPIALLDVTPQQQTHPLPAGNAIQPLIWQQVQWNIGGTDYKPILASVTVSITNNLQRIGTRNLIFDATDPTQEEAISRTPYKILPGLEKVQVTYQLHDKLPAALATTSDWGQVTLHAEQPGSGAGRCYLTVRIDHHFLNRHGMGEVPAGQPITFTADVAAFAVQIDAGLTTS